MDSPLIIERQHPVVFIQINNPPMNPIGVAQVEALEQLLPELALDQSVRAIVISGAGGKNFSVGANLKEGQIAFETGPKKFIEQRISLFNFIEAMEKPVIAAIRGYCLGGGMELAMSCHFRIAEQSAQLGLPEINLGIAPLWSGVSRILRLTGRAQALEMLLLGKHISAEKALQFALLNEVAAAEMFEQRIKDFAGELAEKPPMAVAAILRVVNHSRDLTLEDSLAYELEAFDQLSGSKDNIEGVTALFEKRKPVFSGE